MPLDLDKWAEIIKEYCTDRQLAVDVEPGDYLVKDAGLLLLGITFGEQKKQNTHFLGVDGGFNIAPEPAYYKLPFQPVPLFTGGSDTYRPFMWQETSMKPLMSGMKISCFPT